MEMATILPVISSSLPQVLFFVLGQCFTHGIPDNQLLGPGANTTVHLPAAFVHIQPYSCLNHGAVPLEQPRLSIQALLQVHYSSVRPPADRSGVRLKLTDAALPFSAGMMMFASYFTIPPGLPSHHVPTRCCYSGFEPTHGFAYRVHTHALGR